MSPEIASMISGRSRRRRCCSGVSRFCTYRSFRISLSERPPSCSRITYLATCSSAELRWKRNENMFLNEDTRSDCIPGYEEKLEGGSVCRAHVGGGGRRGGGGADRGLDRTA